MIRIKIYMRISPITMKKSDEKAMLQRLAAANNPNATAIAKALEIAKAEEEEKQVKNLLEALANIDAQEQEAYQQFKQAEKVAKARLNFLKAISTAKAEFEKTGDISAYNSTYGDAFLKLRRQTF